MSEMENRNEEIVKSFFETLSTGNLERLRPLLHEEATWTVMATGIPGAGQKKGRKAIIDDFLAPVRGTFVDGDPKVHIDRMISKGSVVAAEMRGLGHFKNGKEYSNRYAFIIEIKDDKVFALREYMDSYYVSTLG
jgi:ketosteroid isomerase-like protein